VYGGRKRQEKPGKEEGTQKVFLLPRKYINIQKKKSQIQMILKKMFYIELLPNITTEANSLLSTK
jgi:hypothetical protein